MTGVISGGDRLEAFVEELRRVAPNSQPEEAKRCVIAIASSGFSTRSIEVSDSLEAAKAINEVFGIEIAPDALSCLLNGYDDGCCLCLDDINCDWYELGSELRDISDRD